ncbi:MAG: universal stress protein [Chloroflexota bacterium]
MKYVVVYDGMPDSKEALRYGLRRARVSAGELRVLCLYDPDAGVDYHEGRDAEALRESCRNIDDACQIIEEIGKDLDVRVVPFDEDVIEAAARHGEGEKTDAVIVCPRYRSIRAKVSCPVAIVPGSILVPVDNTGSAQGIVDEVVAEAEATAAPVILLGIIPIHLYSPSEGAVRQIEKETIAEMHRLRMMLAREGIDVTEMVRKGFPDEEISKVIQERDISIVLVAGGKKPSELAKAAFMLLNEPDKTTAPVLFLPPAVSE